jgi:hypothetical protein
MILRGFHEHLVEQLGGLFEECLVYADFLALGGLKCEFDYVYTQHAGNIVVSEAPVLITVEERLMTYSKSNLKSDILIAQNR